MLKAQNPIKMERVTSTLQSIWQGLFFPDPAHPAAAAAPLPQEA
jgi:hypothetical protein